MNLRPSVFYGILLMCAIANLARTQEAPVYWSGREAPDFRWSNINNWNRHIPFGQIKENSQFVFDQYSSEEGRRTPDLDRDISADSVLFHGGGFVLGSSNGFELSLPLTATAKTSAAVINIDGHNEINHRVRFRNGVKEARAVYVDGGTLVFGDNSVIDLNEAAKESSWSGTYINVNEGARLETRGMIIANVSGTGVARLMKEGAGDWVIGGNNDLSRFGDIRLDGGRIILESGNPTGGIEITNSPSTAVNRDILLEKPGTVVSTPINLIITSGVKSMMSIGGVNTSGVVTFNGIIRLSAVGSEEQLGFTQFYAAEGGTVVFRQVVRDNNSANDTRRGAVEKVGGGIMIFEAANTYSNGTRVSEGTLLFNNVSGSGAGPGNVTLRNATVGGCGSISGTLITEGSNSIISPGGGEAYAGDVLTVGALDISAGATFKKGAQGARLDVLSAVLGGGDLVFDFSDAAENTPRGTIWTLLTFSSSQNLRESQLSHQGLPASLNGRFVVTQNTVEFMVGGGEAVIPNDISAPPFGLKTYTDIGVIFDETMTARMLDAGQVPSGRSSATWTEGPDGTREYPLYDANNRIRLGVGGETNSARWFTQPTVLWCSYSKDNGETWSEPRFIAASVGEDAVLNDPILVRDGARAFTVSFMNHKGRYVEVHFREDDLQRMATAGDIMRSPAGSYARPSPAASLWGSNEEVIAPVVSAAQGGIIHTDAPPPGYRTDADIGMVVGNAAVGTVFHRAQNRPNTLYGPRTVQAANGDILVMIPDGYYGSSLVNRNSQVCYRSSDGGATWTLQSENLFPDPIIHYTAVPMLDVHGGEGHIWNFETLRNKADNGTDQAYGYYLSTDNGVTWSEPRVIRVNTSTTQNRTWAGLALLPYVQTSAGTWAIGFHHGRVLRGALTGSGDERTWVIHEQHRVDIDPGYEAKIHHLDELGLVSTGNTTIYAQYRTNGGFLGEMRSSDDAQTWDGLQLTPLVHPDAPPGVFKLSDGVTLFALLHNRAVLRTVHDPIHSEWLTMAMPTGKEIAERRKTPYSLKDWVSRAELWFSLSTDNGVTWSEPRMLCVNALDETISTPSSNYVCSYTDVRAVNGVINIFIPHRFQKVVHLRVEESRLNEFKILDELRENYTPLRTSPPTCAKKVVLKPKGWTLVTRKDECARFYVSGQCGLRE